MNGSQCPLCQKGNRKTIQGNFDYFECEVCKGVDIDSRLVRAQTTLDNWNDLLGAARELRDEFTLSPTIHFDGSVSCPDFDAVKHSIQRYPVSIRERANKLLQALVN